MVTDYDGNVYHTIVIGDQEWTVENLRTTHTSNGTLITLITGTTAWTGGTPGMCYYDNNIANASVYGALYNWYSWDTWNLNAFYRNGVWEYDWRLPSLDDYNILCNTLGSNYYAGERMKEAGTSHWLSGGILYCENSSKFTGLPGGVRYSDGLFYDIRLYGNFLTQTEDGSYPWVVYLSYDTSFYRYDTYNRSDGFSIRSVRSIKSQASGVEETLCICLSDETTNLLTGTSIVSFCMPFSLVLNSIKTYSNGYSGEEQRISGVMMNVNTAPTGSNIIVDINDGTTIFSTRLNIDASGYDSRNSGTQPTYTTTSFIILLEGTLITFDIDQVGSSIPGKGLKVFLTGTKIPYLD